MKLRSEETLIQARGVGFAYEGAMVLEEIDLSLRRREVVTLVGPNGAGKSTLAKLIVGILKPKQGSVGRDVKLTVGYVPQHLQMDHTMPMTVGRFVALGNPARDHGKAAMERLGIIALAKRQMRELSGGQQQRVLLARALSRNPDLLVLDEPGQGLDVEGQRELSRLLADERNRGAAVLMISHDLSLVLACTDRVLCIDRTICCAGTPDSVASDPAYLSTLGPTAAEAFALYRQHRHGEVVPLENRAGHA